MFVVDNVGVEVIITEALDDINVDELVEERPDDEKLVGPLVALLKLEEFEIMIIVDEATVNDAVGDGEGLELLLDIEVMPVDEL